jgi:hypothetical protein
MQVSTFRIVYDTAGCTVTAPRRYNPMRGALSEYTRSSVKDSRGVRAGDSSLAIARWREILSVERIPQYKPYAGDFVTVVLY